MTDPNKQPDLSGMGAAAAKTIGEALERFPVMLQAGLTELRRQAEVAGKTLGEAMVALREQATDQPAVTRENPGPWPYDALARQEWPHVPLQLARAYADEYVQTGRRP